MQQRIIWSAAQEDPNTCVLNVAYRLMRRPKNPLLVQIPHQSRNKILNAIFLDKCSERRI